jgi:pyrroloquinoline quinone biosynthesis protein B
MVVTVLASGCGAERLETAEQAATGPKLVLLGTAQDGGFPHAACACVRCTEARSDRSRARLIASVALVDPGTSQRILVDAGPDIRAQLERLHSADPDRPDRVDRSPVAGVMLTHAHLGHYTGLGFFGFEAVHTQNMPVWCSGSMAGYLRENGPWSQLVEIGNIQLREISPWEPFEPLPGIEVTAVAVPHRDEYADTFGFLFRGPESTVFYAPDTDSWEHWDPPVTELLQQVDVAILDATFYSADELPGRRAEEIGHPLVTATMDLLQPLVDGGRLQVWFTHMNHSNPVLGPGRQARAEVERRGFHIAEDGLEFPL